MEIVRCERPKISHQIFSSENETCREKKYLKIIGGTVGLHCLLTSSILLINLLSLQL